MVSWTLWPGEHSTALRLMTLTILAYPLSYYLPRVFRPVLRRSGVSGRPLEIWVVLLDRLTATIVLGGAALWARAAWLPARANHYGFNLERLGLSLTVATVVCAVVAIALGWCARLRWQWVFKGYPQIQVNCWDLRLLVVNSLAWIVYLVAYELLFRGVLLYPVADEYGEWGAILITTGLYCFAHLVKEPHEMFITVIVGLLFGVMALLTGSLVAPLIIHCFTAIFNDVAALRVRPGVIRLPRCAPDAA